MSKESIENKLDPKMVEALRKSAGDKPANEEETDKPENRNLRGGKPRYKNPTTVEDALKHYPTHIVKLVNLVKSNSDIRRYTSLGILNYLSQKGIINNPKGYVTFNWTKFRVVTNGLSTEYRYSEPFFINCLIASFTSFANSAQKIIKTYCSKEYDETFVQDNDVIDAAVNACETLDEANNED